LLDVGKKYKSTVKLKEMALPQKMARKFAGAREQRTSWR
jgi:hypothetical protein